MSWPEFNHPIWDQDTFKLIGCKARNGQLVACDSEFVYSIFGQTLKPVSVWKATRRRLGDRTQSCLTNLELPTNTQVHVRADYDHYDLNSRKWRADKATVLEHECSPMGFWEKVFGAKPPITESLQTSKFKYPVGETVKPVKPFSQDPEECESGIHFFVRRQDAKDWVQI